MRPATARPPRNGWLDRRQVQQGRRLYRAARRFQDVLLAGAALAVLWPAMAAVALAIWLDSPGGSPFFVQQRVGADERPAVPAVQIPHHGARCRGTPGTGAALQ